MVNKIYDEFKMSNEYLSGLEYLKILSNSPYRLRDESNFKSIENKVKITAMAYSKGIVPDNVEFIKNMDSFVFRSVFVKFFGFTMFSKQWINPLVDFLKDKKVLEVMSGNGLLSCILQKKGVQIVTTDNNSWNWKYKYCDIENIDCLKAIEKYGKDVDYVLMSWPEMNDTAYNVLTKVKEINPKIQIIYIGEGYCGCTANELFFDNAIVVEDESFKQVQSGYIPWDCLHDYIELFE